MSWICVHAWVSKAQLYDPGVHHSSAVSKRHLRIGSILSQKTRTTTMYQKQHQRVRSSHWGIMAAIYSAVASSCRRRGYLHLHASPTLRLARLSRILRLRPHSLSNHLFFTIVKCGRSLHWSINYRSLKIRVKAHNRPKEVKIMKLKSDFSMEKSLLYQ